MSSEQVPRSFAHHMLREIYEQPEAIACTLNHYLLPAIPGQSQAILSRLRSGPLASVARLFAHHADLIIAASGSSRHAGLAAEVLLEDLASLAVDVEYASEYITRASAARRHPAAPSPVLVLSQSGETADTLAALREAAGRGHPTIAVTNVPNSTMAREAHISLPTLAGPELAVPATKSFTSQLALMALLALVAAGSRDVEAEAGTLGAFSTERDDEPHTNRRRRVEDRVGAPIATHQLAEFLEALTQIPAILAAHLPAWEQSIAALVPIYADARTFLYLGRGVHYAIAREGALKLKESSYLHAEGYPTGELRHGPNALVSPEVPLVVLATVDRAFSESVLRYERTVALLEDLRKQGARILALANAGDTLIPTLATHTIPIPAAPEPLLPILETVPLQLFAYFTALHQGIDVDHPRNLTKSVSTE